MHPDQNRINQILGKCTSKNQISTVLTELTGLVQKDIKAGDSSEAREYFQELQTCLNTGLSKVSDPTLKNELKSQISNFIATQQKGGSSKGTHL